MNYQGYLEDSTGEPLTDSISMTFKIYSIPSGGSALWTEGLYVGVENGVFDVVLGQNTYIPDSVFLYGMDRWMELSVDGEVLAPRTRICMVPYAYKAHVSDTANLSMNSMFAYDAYHAFQADSADEAQHALTADYADTAGYALSGAGGSDTDWLIVGDVIYTYDQWGISRGDAGNMLYGSHDETHTNLGTSCTTGVSGMNYYSATVAGGEGNKAGNSYTAVTGGRYNSATGSYAMVGAGLQNEANGFGTFIGGGQDNVSSGYEASIPGGRQNTATGDYANVGGGSTNEAGGNYSTVSGGWLNSAPGLESAVSGGFKNLASGNLSVVSGGREDSTYGHLSGVLSGYDNLAGDNALDSASVVCGGRDNEIVSRYGFIGGGRANLVDNNYNVIGGGRGNEAGGTGAYVTVAGGYQNKSYQLGSGIAGGYSNFVDAQNGFIGGGEYNYVSGYASTIAGGSSDTATGSHSTIGGGNENIVSGEGTTIAGGYFNLASGDKATVGGGYGNEATGDYSAIPGGVGCEADGYNTFAFGYDAHCNGYDRSVVFDWGGYGGHFFIGTDALSTTYRLYVSGNAYATGVWNSSDREFKTNVRPIESPLGLVDQLRPVRYTWRENLESYGIEEAREDVGFIAQDLEQVLPEVVREMDDEGHLAVNYNHITAINTAAIKDLLDRIERLEARIEELQSR
jgi:hypothetical protein